MMAEYNDVIKQFERMCWYYQRKRGCPMDCPMVGLNVSQCRKVAFEQPKITERTIMDWAAEHPEPVYPTWGEWLSEQGVVIKTIDNGALFFEPDAKMRQPIPANIAQKLGIEPKEDVC